MSEELRDIERRWQDEWFERGIFQADAPSDAERAAARKFYLNVAYPYPSGAMHVGHGRTYTIPDVIARFKRMKGFNVLFPMAFHVTGTPVIGISKRIAAGDESAIRLYRDIYKVPEDELRKFVVPERIVSYFTAEYRMVMRELGLSIDWRRCFTTVDSHYQKFIRWQFNKLNEKGYIGKGVHPVKYCPSCGNPVGDHDLLAGEGASILEFTLLKFMHIPRHGESAAVFLPAATLRPETVFGVTNLWVNPNVKYVIARIRHDGDSGVRINAGNRANSTSDCESSEDENEEDSEHSENKEEEYERWIISEECASKLTYQGYAVEVEKELSGSDIIGDFAVNPMNGTRVEILPADFVDPSFGTGVVMSVPAHAPYDFVALRDLHRSGKYMHISPVTIIRTEAYGGGEKGIPPAEVIVDRMGIEDQHDERLEKATEELYAAEFNSGEMIVGEYAGMNVSEARERVRDVLLSRGLASKMYEFSERPVICRCNTGVVVSLMSDQWFLRYDDENWKSDVRALIEEISFVPPEIKAEFLQTVEWLREWACARRIGLGTKLPWDERWIIEPLSDSTIYMAYYTISHIIKKIKDVDENAFDYIFLGNKAYDGKYEDMRREFLYWYPYDLRFSAKDLVRNHLTFQIFHHVAIFPREKWPRGIVVFGMATKDGKKMSSSKGNIVLLSDAIERYGADAVRFFLISAAEPWQDFDWRDDLAFAARKHVERFFNTAVDILNLISSAHQTAEADMTADAYEMPDDSVSRWILSRTQRHIRETTDALEKLQCRKALQHAFFNMENDLRWFRRRAANPDLNVLRYVLDVWVRLLSPFIPHVCEEIWRRMGGKGFVSLASYPEVCDAYIDRKSEISEEILAGVVEDLNEILKVTGISPQKITLFVAERWKRDLLANVCRMLCDGKGMNEIIPAIMRSNDERIKEHHREIPDLVRKIVERLSEKGWSDVPEIADVDEITLLKSAQDFLQQEFGCPFEIYDAESVDERTDPKNRRKTAIPTRPAIFVV